MRTFDRKSLLQELEYNSDWETVRDWIRDMVVVEPKIMRKVSEAKFGDLGSWIEAGRGNVSVCGCLVGTTAIELTKERNHFKADRDTEKFLCTKEIGEWVPVAIDEAACRVGNYSLQSTAGAAEVVDTLTNFKQRMSNSAYDAGVAAAGLKEEIGQEEAVWLIKTEIVRQLGFQKQRVRAARKAIRSVKRDKRTGQFKRAA